MYLGWPIIGSEFIGNNLKCWLKPKVKPMSSNAKTFMGLELFCMMSHCNFTCTFHKIFPEWPPLIHKIECERVKGACVIATHYCFAATNRGITSDLFVESANHSYGFFSQSDDKPVFRLQINFCGAFIGYYLSYIELFAQHSLSNKPTFAARNLHAISWKR